MDLGEKIRKARLEKGLTQRQLAGDRITRNMLSQIENGQASPSMKTLEYLAEKLDVGVGWLLAEEDGTKLYAARKKLREGDYMGAIHAAKAVGAAGEEGHLLLATAAAGEARAAYASGDFARLREYAAMALQQNEKTTYRSEGLEEEMLWLCASCSVLENRKDDALERFRKHYDAAGWEARNHLLLARHHLRAQNLQAAEREIWTITVLPESERPPYLLLRGMLCLAQDKYGNAVSFLRQAEEQGKDNKVLLREVYGCLETCYKALEDYKLAYEYAAKLREI